MKYRVIEKPEPNTALDVHEAWLVRKALDVLDERDRFSPRPTDTLLSPHGVVFTLGQRAYFCPKCFLVMQRSPSMDALECPSCQLEVRRWYALNMGPTGFPDINGRMIDPGLPGSLGPGVPVPEPEPKRPWWRRWFR